MKQIFDPVRLVRRYISRHPVLKPFLALGVVSTVGFAILVVTGQLDWRIALFVVFFNLASWLIAALIPSLAVPPADPGITGGFDKVFRVLGVFSIIAVALVQGFGILILLSIILG